MPRLVPWLIPGLAGLALLGGGAAPAADVSSALRVDVVATSVPRPLQLVVDGQTLVVLSPGLHGDAAGEIYRLNLDGELPVDLSRQPRVRIPFIDERVATLGSLALHPGTGEVFAGEENGTRLYRLSPDGRLTLYATGLRRLGGGGTLAFDGLGRLIVLDYVDPVLSESDERPPPGLEQLREEEFRGPLVFRLTVDPAIPLPRRLARLAPFFPRAGAGGAMLPRLLSVAPLPTGDLMFLSSGGDLYRLGVDGGFVPLVRLPSGYYNRTNMVAAPDGSVFVSGGFHVANVFRVSPDGRVVVFASGLADPEGIALDARGDLYVAESSLHRIIRLRPF